MTPRSDNRWPEVTDPRAREILGYVAALPGCNRSRRFVDRLDADLYKSLSASVTLHGLHETDLADTLLNDPQRLFDLVKATSDEIGNQVIEFRPRNMRQLVEDIAYNLPWYKSTGRGMRSYYFPGIYWIRRLISILLIAAIITVGLFVEFKVIYYLIAVFLIFVGVTSLRSLRNHICRLSGLTDPGFTASLLYHYLLQEYSDPVEGAER